MIPSHTKEVRQLILLGFFLAIVPLVFFPKNFGVRVEFNPFFIFLFELVWYFLALSFLFPSLPSALLVLYSFSTFLFRLTLGLVFGFFLFVMFPIEIGKAFSLGVLNYFPAFIFQVFLLPFIVRHSLGDTLKSFRREKRQKPSFVGQIGEVSYKESKKTLAEKVGKEKPIRSLDAYAKGKEISLEVSIEDAIHYLKEYPGVFGVILVDSDGLVVAKSLSQSLDEDELAPFGVTFREVNTQLLKRLNEEKIERIQILSDKLWINLTSIGKFCLLTLADRHTDELLNIRISKAQENIKKYLEQRYGQKILLPEEEKYVSNLRGA